MSNINRAAKVIGPVMSRWDMAGRPDLPEGIDTHIARALSDAGLLADEHHSAAELYDYRMAYNALLFNEWASAGKHDVHKSWRHSDGELCFGGGWFIVCATTPHGLVSNHCSASSWQYFDIPEREVPVEYDGHTPAEALRRLMDTAAEYAEEVGTDGQDD